MENKNKVAVIGLDCAAPSIFFERLADKLPNLTRLRKEGVWGHLRSCHPPITVPAWACMMSGKDPGLLGVYGFRNRADHSYQKYYFANSSAIHHDRVWDILSRADKYSILIGVPQTYPIKPIRGIVISDFLTPSTQADYVYPKELRPLIEEKVGSYLLDVENFRSENKDDILKQIYEMTRQRYVLAEHFLKTSTWDFFMMVDMGVDRIFHAFWKYMDPTHPKYEKGNCYEKAIDEYCQYVDGLIGKLLTVLGADTTVLVVSDHGAKGMDGGFCINEWLIQQGYLTLKKYPGKSTALNECEIDWSKTLAWGEGGYFSRLFLNVKGREPQGIILPKEYEKVRDELMVKIQNINDHRGQPMGNKICRPEELYKVRNGIPPDLICYFGDLKWRSVGSVGLKSIYTFENDTGPDDANHDWDGIFIMRHKDLPHGAELKDLMIYDVASTVLKCFDHPIPTDMGGRAVFDRFAK